MSTQDVKRERPIFPEEYLHDYYNFMRKQEINLYELKMHSPQKQFRRALLEWMRKACMATGLSVLTLHLGAALLDIFMDNYNIMTYRLKAVTSACLMVAAKFEDNGNLPTYANVFAVPFHVDDELHELPTKNLIPEFEFKVLYRSGWKLHNPTTANFLIFLAPLIIDDLELPTAMRGSKGEQQLRTQLAQLLSNSLDMLLIDERAMHVCGSQLACACMIFARQKLNLSPLWPARLAEFTNYRRNDLEIAIDLVFNPYSVEELSLVPSPRSDSGYCSTPTSPAGGDSTLLPNSSSLADDTQSSLEAM